MRCSGFARRLNEIRQDGLTPVERIEHPIVAAHIRARMFEAEEVRTWERNPQLYGDVLASSLAAQALFAYAPPTERARRVLSKLRQTGRLIQAARDNVKDPPGIFVKVGIETFKGTLTFIERDLPRAFAASTTCTCSATWLMPPPRRRRRSRATSSSSNASRRRRRAARFRLGRQKFEQKLKLDEGIALGADRLLAIAPARAGGDAGGVPAHRRASERLGSDRGLAPRQGESPRAGRDREGRAAADHGARAVRRAAQARDHSRRRTGLVAPTPDFYRWSSASMWTPGPFETKPTRAYYYVTDVDRSWPPDRQEEHLRDFNYPTLWAISMHEVCPGHFLQYQHLRQVDSKVRKSLFFAPASFMEGWAHYCEQMMMEAGFAREDQTLKLGQLQEALIRLVRFVVGIRLHAEDLSVEQGVRLFKEEAFLEEAAARREAERGTFDPRLRRVLRRQIDAAEAAKGRQGAAGREVHAEGVPRCAARAGRRPVLAPIAR